RTKTDRSARRYRQAVFAGGGSQNGMLSNLRGGKGEVPVEARPAVSRHADVQRHHAAMQQAGADLAGNFAVGFAGVEVATGRLQGMADDQANHAQTCLLIGGKAAAQQAESVGHDVSAQQRAVASDLAVLAQVGEELIAAPVPGPFLELEAQPVQLLVE